MLNTEVSYVRHLDRLDREDVTTSTALLNASAFGLRGYVDTLSPLVAMHHIDRSCVIVGKFFEITAFPNIFSIRYLIAA